MKKLLLTLSAVAAVTMYATAQTDVTTAGVKHVLLEEGTGTWCGYCPDGAQELEQTIEPAHPNLIVASFHNGDGMALSPDDFNEAYIQYYGWPGASVDRKIYHAAAWDSLVAEDRGLWSYNVPTEEATAPMFDVSMHIVFDSSVSAQTVTIKVTSKALSAQTGTYYMNCYITEDSISSANPNQQDSYFDAAGSMCVNGMASWYVGLGDPIVPSSKYWHQHVVRAVLATGASMWGDAGVIAANPAANSTATKTYTYTIPSTQKAKHIHVIGLVQKWDAVNKNGGRPVMNAVEAKLPKANLPVVSVAMTGAMDAMEIYPNPANSVINVRGTLRDAVDAQLTITNAVGQVVATKAHKANGNQLSESISLDNMNDGVYFMTIVVNGEKSVQRFIVNKK